MIEIPDIPAGATVYEAALLYAAAGIYVGPLRPGKKDPASSLGKGWPSQTSRDPEQLREWFDGTDANLFIHVGRSGLVVVDVDKPELTPDILRDNLGDGPRQQTRADQPERLHWVFAVPEGLRLGNGLGSIPPGWGDIRGRNGLIVVTPSTHPEGGEYHWVATGPVPELPEPIAAALATSSARTRRDGSDDDEEAASDAEVEAFVAEYSTASRPGALVARVKGFNGMLASGGRHNSLVPVLRGAMEEARAGFYAAQDAIDEMWPPFWAAASVGPKSRSESRARAEFYGLLAWSVAQAEVADLDVVRQRVEDAMGIDGEAAFEDVLRNSAKGSQSTSEQPRPKPARPRIWRADDLDPAAPLKWVGVRHIPEAAVTLLTGDEGIGKSLLWCRIAACISSGRPMPEFGIPKREPRHVLVIATEDDWTTVVRPRLALAGANLANVSVVCTDKDGTGPPSFPSDMDIVEAADPRPYLIVVDAWVDALDANLSVKDAQHARQALGPWSEIAGKFRAAVILLTHTNRGTGTSIRERYALTSELRKKARMALFAQQDEDGRLVVGPDKSNLAGGVNASLFKVEVVKVFDESDDGDGTIGKVVYVGDAGRSAAELLADLATDAKEGDGHKGMAQVALSTVLGDGQEHEADDVIAKMEAAGVSRRSTYRAADKLGVAKERSGFPATSKWRLPAVPTDVPSSDSGTTGTTGTTAGDGPSVVPSADPVVPVVPPETDGKTGGTTDAVEQPDYPLCTGGCGLPIGPTDVAKGRTHHGFCA